MTPAIHALPQVGEPPAGPPLWLPLAFLAQAALWLWLGAIAMTVVASDLALGLTAMPRTFAATHLFTLGVLGAATLGALHQFVPVVTGVGLRHPRAAVWAFWAHGLGVATLVAAMWWWSPRGQLAGWTLLFLAVGLGSWNILPARRRARQNGYVAGFVSLAHSALGLGMLVALVRIGDGLGWWTTWREGQLLAHFHLGWIGYGTLTVAGIGSKMLPAFLGLAEHADSGAAPPVYRRLGWLLSIGLLALSVGAPFRMAWLTWSGAVLLAAGVATHLAVLTGYFLRRKPGPLDPSLAAIGGAVGCYAGAWLLGVGIALVRPAPPRLWTAYGLVAIAGWLTLIIVGVMHRIGPRLMTAFLARRGGGLTLAQRGGQVLDRRLAWGAVVGLTGGLVAETAGVLAGAGAVVRVGSVLYLIGASLMAAQTVRLVKRATLGPSASPPLRPTSGPWPPRRAAP
ncbi:MAG TPA: hypothetical protein VF862_14460 [Gemmatimonadales bacterium]